MKNIIRDESQDILAWWGTDVDGDSCMFARPCNKDDNNDNRFVPVSQIIDVLMKIAELEICSMTKSQVEQELREGGVDVDGFTTRLCAKIAKAKENNSSG